LTDESIFQKKDFFPFIFSHLLLKAFQLILQLLLPSCS